MGGNARVARSDRLRNLTKICLAGLKGLLKESTACILGTWPLTCAIPVKQAFRKTVPLSLLRNNSLYYIMYKFIIPLLFIASTLAVTIDHKREYQMQLFEDRFVNRSQGVANYFAFLKLFEGNPKYNFTLNVTSGYQEIIHERRYDTADQKLDAIHIDLKVINFGNSMCNIEGSTHPNRT